MVEVSEAVRRLEASARSGELAGVCARFGVDLVVLFGSSARGVSDARDVDLAVRFSGSRTPPLLELLDALYTLAGSESVDVLDLGRAGPVAREQALVGGRLLHEAVPGDYATLQITATMERMETEHLRKLDLKAMSR